MNFENPLKRVERLKKVTRRPDTDLGGRISSGSIHHRQVPGVALWGGAGGRPGDVGLSCLWTGRAKPAADWDEFRALPETTLMTDIHCVTRWSKLDTTWCGVPWRDFVKTVEIPRRQRPTT